MFKLLWCQFAFCILHSTYWLHPIPNFALPFQVQPWNLMKRLKLKMLTDFVVLILGVLSHLLIRDGHNCGSCEAISSSLNLIADYHSQESPNYLHCEIPNTSIVALAAVVIFPPSSSSSRWTYWIINIPRSTSTDDVIRLASLRHQLCILDVCQSGVLLSPLLYSRLTPPVLTPTGAVNCMPESWRVSETPLWSASKSRERERRWVGLPSWSCYRSKTKISFSLAGFTGEARVEVGLKVVVGKIEFRRRL